MPEQIHENQYKETESPESEGEIPGLELSAGNQTETVKTGLADIQEALAHDKPVTADRVLSLDKALREIKINFYGEEMTPEQAKEIPDLEQNLRIFKEIESGDLEHAFDLTYLPPRIAEKICFSYYMGEKIRIHYTQLGFHYMKKITDKAADILRRADVDMLVLGSRGHLVPSLETLTALAKRDWEFLDISIPELTEQSAEIISSFKGNLVISNVRQLSEAAAAKLSSHQGNLGIDGLTEITDEAVAQLAKVSGHLFLDDIWNLSDEAVKSLAAREKNLSLAHLLRLSDQAAEYLGGHHAQLNLAFVTEISDKGLGFLANRPSNGESAMVLYNSTQERLDRLKRKQ